MKIYLFLNHLLVEVLILKKYNIKNLKSQNFKYNIDKLEKILEEFNSLQENEYVFDIVSDYTIPEELKNTILNINTQLASKQFIEINKIITYINNKNYFGEEFHNYKNKQIKASKFWISTFLK